MYHLLANRNVLLHGTRTARTLAPCLQRAVAVVLSSTEFHDIAKRVFSTTADKQFEIPKRINQKVVRVSDACQLVSSGDTVCVSGFVAQGSPDAILEGLGERFEKTSEPNNLTLLFGGGPGDWDKKGLNYLAKVKTECVTDDATGESKEAEKKMLQRTVGSHYGQIPKIENLALSNKVEAWTLPLGSISRMIRAQATHSPGHITNVGIGTYIDPDVGNGGAANESAATSQLNSELVTKLNIAGQDHLMYRALPIHVAIIRGTTADASGNISVEHESLLCDQRETATAARNSGGIVLAQVKRLASVGSLPANAITVPGALVDCVVVVDEEDHDRLHPMNYVSKHDPVLSCEMRSPTDDVERLELNERKVIARRASFALKPGKVVNLGIGKSEGVASVAAEEDLMQYITLTTESGVFGGVPKGGKNFGTATNAEARIEMNQIFDFYDGGGLDMCFRGAAQIAPNGDVNASRLSKDKLMGPGGFIDITQSTRNICYMLSFTAKGLQVSIPGDGTISISSEGRVKRFVSTVFEKTFSGDEAVRRGQKVFYVTERAVFRRSAKHDVIELIEIAPGIDLQKDILDQMEFKPVVSNRLKLMDDRIFKPDKMGLSRHMFGSLDDRCIYHEDDHTLFIDLFGVNITTEEDMQWFFEGLDQIMSELTKEKGPLNMIANYDGFDIRSNLEDKYVEEVAELEKKYYRSARRYSGPLFRRAKLKQSIYVKKWDAEKLFDHLDRNKDGKVSIQNIRKGMKDEFGLNLSPSELALFKPDAVDNTGYVSRKEFTSNAGRILTKLLKKHI